MNKIKNINWQDCLKKCWPFIVILLMTYLLAAIQLRNGGTILDIDTIFHYNRFFDASEQLRTGNFSYFQTNFAFNQSGRVVNAVYGPLFAYFNGLLILIFGTWYNYQIATYFIICMFAGTGMYLLARKTNVNKYISTALAILYLNIGTIQAWFDHSNLAAWGGAFAPFVLIEGINMVQNHRSPLRWIRLMLVMSLVAQIHILSTLILSLALIPFWFAGYFKANDRKKMIVDLIKAIVGTIILSANVWGAILVIYQNQIAPTLSHNLAKNALKISGYGSLRDDILASLLFIFIVQVIYVLLNYKKMPLNLFVTIEGSIFLFLSSKLMPWDFLQSKVKILTSYLQFPHRFLLVAYPLLLLGIGLSINSLNLLKDNIFYKIAWVTIGVVILENFGSNYYRITQRSTFNRAEVYRANSSKYYSTKNMYDKYRYTESINDMPDDYLVSGFSKDDKSKLYVQVPARGIYYKNTGDINKINQILHDKNKKKQLLDLIIKINPDYLPIYHGKKSGSEVDYYYINNVIKPEQSGKFKYKVLKSGTLKLTWNSPKNGEISLPLVMYKQSRLIVNDKEMHNPRLGEIGTPTIKQKIGKNTAVLRFITPVWFKILSITSMLAWIIMCIYIVKYLCRYRKRLRRI